MTIALTSVSYNKDDDNKTASIEGKWVFSKDGDTELTLTNYEHTIGCNKDYMIIEVGGKITFYSYYKEGNSCIENIETAIWVRNENRVTISYGEVDIYETEIINLTNTELKTKDLDEEGATTITVFTRG